VGPFTAWKALAGQHVTELGDLRLARFTHSTFDVATLAYRSVVTQATHLANEFAGQSLLRAQLQASFPILFDTAVTATIAALPGLAGLMEAHRPPVSDLQQKLTPAVPPTGHVTQPSK
jgi:hypothetical protein